MGSFDHRQPKDIYNERLIGKIEKLSAYVLSPTKLSQPEILEKSALQSPRQLSPPRV
jgi:hypothetical protein